MEHNIVRDYSDTKQLTVVSMPWVMQLWVINILNNEAAPYSPFSLPNSYQTEEVSYPCSWWFNPEYFRDFSVAFKYHISMFPPILGPPTTNPTLRKQKNRNKVAVGGQPYPT